MDGESFNPSPWLLDFCNFAAACNRACRLSRFLGCVFDPSSSPTTFRLGVVSGSTVEVDEEGVMGIDHSSSLASGEVAFDEDTSPRREGCFLRDLLASDREDDDDAIIL